MKIAIAAVVLLLIVIAIMRSPGSVTDPSPVASAEAVVGEAAVPDSNAVAIEESHESSAIELSELQQKYLSADEQQVYLALAQRALEANERFETTGSKEAQSEVLKLTEEMARWDAWVTERKYQYGDY